MVDIRQLIDVENATQSKRIFWEQEIYQLELERIFARCWIFLTHECLIPNVGDFVTAKMGQDEVIVLRQRDGSIKAFLNHCTHRGMKLCMAEAGNARGFSCNYHGWGFGIDGELRGVPGEEEAYGKNFDKSRLGLRPVAKVESFRGFIFGCLDPKAPTLAEYLGEIGPLMDAWADVPGGIELLGPPSRSIVNGNWKVPTENFVGDAYHVPWSHASINKVLMPMPLDVKMIAGPDVGFQVTSRNGHGLGVMYGAGVITVGLMYPELREWNARRKEELTEKVGAWRAQLYEGHWDGAIFPNCSYLFGTNTFKVWNPIGPNQLEILTWAIVEKDMPENVKNAARSAANRTFGSAGTLESDDIDNFDYCNRPNEGYVTRQGVVTCQMGMGEEREDPNFPGLVVGNFVSELAYRGFYRFYADCMSAKDWEELNASTADWKKSHLGK
jgi:3-phenylpropionate/trans-cinnamate dioxygenase alpha subunit